MPTTMRDVAHKAGVSIKTVSRVVNDQGEISDRTRQRVLAAIDDLRYRPSRVARALVTQSSYTIGLVTVDINNPFFPEVAQGVIETAREKGYNVFLCNTDGSPDQELSTLQSLADNSVDGIIFYPTYESGVTLEQFVEQYQPIVVLNYDFEDHRVSQVMLDSCLGAKLAVDYLVGLGHQSIGMITGVQDISEGKVRRVDGYREAMRHHNISIDESWIMPGAEPTVEVGYETTKQLLVSQPEISAIFTYNDLLAIGALKACHELSLSVPQDCAIIGFDDIQFSAMVIPSLSTVRIDKYDLGRQATNRLFDMLKEPDKAYPPITVKPELIIREST
ncbi:MAG: LacI family DNA-binding transcriptional regulator [Chloroflexota bacterium]